MFVVRDGPSVEEVVVRGGPSVEVVVHTIIQLEIVIRIIFV